MRPWWWACGLGAVLTCSVSYLLLNESVLPGRPLIASGEAAQPSFAQDADQLVTDKDQARLQDAEKASADLKQDQSPVARQDEAPVAQQNEAPVAQQDRSPVAQQDQPLIAQQEARLEDASRPEELESFRPEAVEPSSPEAIEPSGPEAAEPPTPSDTKQNLSWLSYYAYSELPPDPKPADIVLEALSGSPRGTPIEEIRRVADILGLDPTFMKAVAKIESGFDPKQRTGSYIGLFQLSQAEFDKYGSGDIRDPRDNAVAGALKIMTEGILFEMFTHKKPTLYDLYLVHQQGVDAATEHVTHPKQLAWRSMCATDEGKEKGEKWCKRAIWGNTLPAIKKAWKNVNKLTSAAFVGMWQQRVSEFYARYSAAAAN